jgi:hypothetical protein
MSATEAAEATEEEFPAGDQPQTEPAGAPPLASKPAARLSRKERIAGAWVEVERVFGEKHSKWLRAGRLTDEEALKLEKLASEADKKQVRAVMLQNRSFREAVDSLTGLNPQNTIEDLHTKTVQSGGSFVGQIGEFLHVVAFIEKGRGRAARAPQRMAGKLRLPE